MANTASSTGGSCSACGPITNQLSNINTVKTLFLINGVAATTTSTVKPGDVLVYRLVSANDGGANGSVTLSDPVPANTTKSGSEAGWSCANGAVAGAACTQTVNVASNVAFTTFYTVTVNATLSSGAGSLANTATSSGGSCNACGPISNPVVNIDTVKTLSSINGRAATATSIVKPGDTLVYTLVSTNTGGAAGRVVLSDPVPADMTKSGAEAGWSCADGSGASTSCVQTVTVAAGVSLATSYAAKVVATLPSGTAQVANTATSSGGSCSSCGPITNLTTDSLLVTKTTTAKRVRVGDFVPYTVRLKNVQSLPLNLFGLLDNPAPGLSYVEDSLRVVGASQWQISSLRPLKVEGLSLAANQTLTLTYLMRVGAAAGKGQLCNQASVDDAKRQAYSNVASVCVIRSSDPDFEDTRIFGIVFDDRNGNGVQDDGERGLPGVRMATATGYVAQTDSLGRYHFEGIDPGEFARGSNFIVKLDEDMLAKGSVLTTQNPLVKRLTWAIPAQFNFGVRQAYSQLVLYEAAVQKETPLVAPAVVPSTPTALQPPVQTLPYAFAVDGLFEFDRTALADIVDPGRTNLAHFVRRIQQDFSRIGSVVLTAHTDRFGTDPYNQELARKRAETVQAYLVQNGIDGQLIHTVAVGSVQPVVDCPGTQSAAVIACMAPNRRFEIQVQGLAAVRKNESITPPENK